MNVVTLYKTWRGHEFVEPSIESIYPYSDAIVFVHSNTSWTGERGANTVKPVVDKWAEQYDSEKKIVNIVGDYQTQEEQYRAGFELIQRELKPDFIILFDTDEIIGKEDIERALQHAYDDVAGTLAFRCLIHAYVKTPFYRVEPEERCHPVLLVRGDINPKEFVGPRGLHIRNVYDMTDVHIHHLTMVRDSWEDIEQKIRTSHIADKTNHVDIDTWKREKWNKIPNSTNLHPTAGAESCWAKVRSVGIAELPETLRKRLSVEDNMSRQIQDGRRQSRHKLIRIGRACNARCQHCEMVNNDIAYFVSVSTIEQEIRDAAGEDYTGIVLSGGEPTLHPEILHFIEYAKSRNMVVEIETHGSITKNRTQELVDAGVTGFFVSFYGGESIHNRVVYIENAREQQMKFLNTIPTGVRIQAKFISTNETASAVGDAAFVATKWKIHSFNCIYYDGNVDIDSLMNAVKRVKKTGADIRLINYNKEDLINDMHQYIANIDDMYKPQHEHNKPVLLEPEIQPAQLSFGPGHAEWKKPENRHKWLREHVKGVEINESDVSDENIVSTTLDHKRQKALETAGLPIDFGEEHPDWGIPSKMHRYIEAMKTLAEG